MSPTCPGRTSQKSYLPRQDIKHKNNLGVLTEDIARVLLTQEDVAGVLLTQGDVQRVLPT